MFKHLCNQLIDWLLPPCCVLCGFTTQRTQTICLACQKNLPILPHHCQQCAQFLPMVTQSPAKYCGECKLSPPAFNKVYALFPYEPPISQLIIRLKFQHQLNNAKALAELLLTRIQSEWYLTNPLPDVIIPIPLHPKRLQERGFNQAVEIARPVAKALGIALDLYGIERTKATSAQSGLPTASRKQNMTNAFELRKNYAGLSVVLVDDVMTTGYTITECSRLLQKNGANRIDIWCAARRG